MNRELVDYSTIIVGQEKPGQYEVFTVHPGPIEPRGVVIDDPKLVGRTVTVGEARRLGFVSAKTR